MQKLLTVVVSFVTSFVTTSLAVAFYCLPLSSAHAELLETHRNQLADIVDNQCLANFYKRHSPWPCSHVDLTQGYVIMQDMIGSGHYLLIATSPVSGIESSALLADESPRYFHNAWQHRSLVAATRGTSIDEEDIGILVNSLPIRTQDRFHLHIAPLHRPFARLLKQQTTNITADGKTLIWEGRAFHVWKISEHALAHTNPLSMIVQRTIKATPDMSRTAVLLASAGKNAQGEKELYVVEIYYPRRTDDGWFPEHLLDWRSAPVAFRHHQSAGA